MEGRGLPESAPPDTSGQHPIALTRYDPVSQTFGFILDAARLTRVTARLVMFGKIPARPGDLRGAPELA
jgi:hypothetical protein